MSQKPQRRKPFNGRGFISFVLLLSFIVMTVSGVVLYVAPKGRVANWTGWAVWGLDKEEWAALHTVISLLFVVVTPLHIYYNWAVFWNYFKRRFEKGFNLKREFAISVVVCAVFVVGSIWQIPPFHYLTRWNDSIKDYWERVSAHPPVPHAEEWTITELADRTGIAVDVIIARFETEGYHVESPNQTLEDIGYENGVSPKALFALVDASKGGSRRGATVDGYGSGRGLGRQTLAEYCRERDVAVGDVLQKLESAGIAARADQRMKTIADSAGLTPGELVGVIER